MIELVDPRGVAPKAARSLARRIGSPDALRRIGFLSNEPEHMTGPHFPGYTRFLERALRERLGVTDAELVGKIEELDLMDGQLDGKLRKPPLQCPDCDRIIPRKFSRCLYCGIEIQPDPFG